MKPCRAVFASIAVPVMAVAASAQCGEQLTTAREFFAAVTHDGRAYFAGGSGSRLVEVFDPTTRTWSFDQLSSRRWRLAGVAVADELLFAGGDDGPGFSDVVDVLDLSTGTWSLARLAVPRSNLVAASADGVALFFGGLGAAGLELGVDLYDQAAGTWSTTSLPTPRVGVAAIGLGQRIFVAGGALPGPDDSDAFDIYDVPSGSWSSETLSEARFECAIATVGTKVIVAGGATQNPIGVSATVDIYDLSTDTWSTAALSQARYWAVAATVGTRVIIAGGWNDAGEISDRVDVYDDSTGLWWQASLSAARIGARAVAAGSTALIAGGRGAATGGLLASIDVFTAELATPYCFGDGSGAACPCGNAGGALAGCASSVGPGARLRSDGGQCFASDDLELVADGLVPGQLAVLFAGEHAAGGGAGLPMGDGLLCVAGALVRYPGQQVPASGSLAFGPGLAGVGGWGPGDTRRFQVFYRDGAGPCSTGFNMTGAIEQRFLP